MRAIRLTTLAAALLLLTLPGSAQFRSSTDLVSIYATVQDTSTRLVPDLTQDDFVVLDNGREQPIAFFSNEITPFSVVIMLDRSGSMLPHQFVLRDAASEFVRRMLPEDKARIGSFGNYVGNRVVISPSVFSSSKDELLGVLYAPLSTGAFSPVYIAIDQSISALAARDGRRVVLIFTDGYDQPSKTMLPVSLKDLIGRIRETNTMVYALGFADVQRREGRSPRVTPPHSSLRELADDSGGGYFEITDTADLMSVFTRVAEELHRQYWLGITPPERDGKVHTLQVRVKRPQTIVRARQTYPAPSAK
jgi:Ca-activated chloride channel family protein